jgi:hypothetical protein
LAGRAQCEITAGISSGGYFIFSALFFEIIWRGVLPGTTIAPMDRIQS